jgi:hypothetical protein
MICSDLKDVAKVQKTSTVAPGRQRFARGGFDYELLKLIKYMGGKRLPKIKNLNARG